MKPYIIGVTGGSGSGKSRFIEKIESECTDSQVTFISQDDYYFPREVQKSDANGIKNFDLPGSIDVDSLIKDLKKLISGEEVERKEYTFNNELKDSNTISYKANPVILIEGLFVFHFEKLRSFFDLKLFVEASDNIKLIRRIKRDKEERNYPLEDVLYRFEHHVMPAYHAYIKPYLAEADLIINNDQDVEKAAKVLTAFIRSKSNS